MSQIIDTLRALDTVARVDGYDQVGLRAEIIQCAAQAPVLGSFKPTTVSKPSWRSDSARMTRVSTVRYEVALEVHGDPHLLFFWPDLNTDSAVWPADHPEWPRIPLTFDDPVDHWVLQPLAVAGHHGNQLVLSTFIDLTTDEEALVARGELDVQAIFIQRRNRIEPIANAIYAETVHFFEIEAPAQVEPFLAERRRLLANREAVSASLAFPDEWTLPDPALALEPARSSDSSGAVNITVPITARLAPVSFAGLQRTIRTWADAMERYPKTFAQLDEDPISDLLAATLNATLAGAHREVYSRSGKSDIFVTADVLNEGSGPARIFIAEAKWATSDAIVRRAVDPQLFGYLTASDTSAILLLLFDQQDRDAAERRYLDILRSIDGYLGEGSSSVLGWPVYIYERDGRVVNLAIATVHLPRSGGKQLKRIR